MLEQVIKSVVDFDLRMVGDKFATTIPGKMTFMSLYVLRFHA